MAASSSTVVLSMSSIQSGSDDQPGRSLSPTAFSTASSPAARKPSLRKIAMAMPKALPIASPRNDV